MSEIFEMLDILDILDMLDVFETCILHVKIVLDTLDVLDIIDTVYLLDPVIYAGYIGHVQSIHDALTLGKGTHCLRSWNEFTFILVHL